MDKDNYCPSLSKNLHKIVEFQRNFELALTKEIFLQNEQKRYKLRNNLENNLEIIYSFRKFEFESSKAYDCLAHDILLAKIEAYGLDMASLSSLKNYLANRKQRTKVGSSYSDWFEFIRGILQDFVLGS